MDERCLIQNALVTTGLIPLTIGSVYLFQLQAWKDGLPWDLTGGVVNIKLADPTGAVFSFMATITGHIAQYSFVIPATSSGQPSVGAWIRAWDVTDALGIHQISRGKTFDVISSPV